MTTNDHRDLPAEFIIARALEHLISEYLHHEVDAGELSIAMTRLYPGMDRGAAERIAQDFIDIVDETELGDLHDVVEVSIVVNDLPDGPVVE